MIMICNFLLLMCISLIWICMFSDVDWYFSDVGLSFSDIDWYFSDIDLPPYGTDWYFSDIDLPFM